MNFLWQSDNTSSRNGVDTWIIRFIKILVTVFIVLKLIGVISWSWLWVLSPIWIVSLLWLVVVLGIILVARNY